MKVRFLTLRSYKFLTFVYRNCMLTFSDDLVAEDGMIDLYHEMLVRIENSINDIAQYTSVSIHLFLSRIFILDYNYISFYFNMFL